MVSVIQHPIPGGERVAKGFYSRFKTERASFLAAIRGVPAERDCAAYVSLMLNRLMFAYFLQHKGLLDGDTDYLCHRLHIMRTCKGKNTFYRDFLLPFFHQGLGGKQRQATGIKALLGSIPYLDFDLFKEHVLERNPIAISIDDEAFAQLFTFFDSYQWRLDEGPSCHEHELRPDILGFVCERSINQEGVGAYYTGEDVTEYIARNTIIPYLFESVQVRCPLAFETGTSIWQLLQSDPDRYIYESIRRTDYLPTETRREYQDRHSRYEQLRAMLIMGSVRSIHALLTHNLDIHQFAQDVLTRCKEPDVLQVFYECLTQIAILDPTCGAGAFLLAALKVLEPLYELCAARLRLPLLGNRQSILASIIANNLYGVDIMEEAVEVCKSRLLLRLLASNSPGQGCSILSNIQCNVRVGDALVDSVRAGKEGERRIAGIHESGTVKSGRTSPGTKPPQEGVMPPVDTRLRPFRWSVEFSCVRERGGFDVIIGNPPYVECSRVRQDYAARGYEIESCGNLYAAVLERSLVLCRPGSYMGLIVPLSICSAQRFGQLRSTLVENTSSLWLSNFEIFPNRLFYGAFQRLTILIARRGIADNSTLQTTHVTRIQRWYATERPHLLPLIAYTSVQQTLRPGVFPKLASPQHQTILHKVLERARDSSIATMLSPHRTQHFVYYQEATNYWMKATCCVPFYRKNDVVMVPPHGRFLFFRDEITTRIVMALMNSSHFYLWFATYSDGFHLSHALVKEFPVAKELYGLGELFLLSVRLEEDIRAHATMSTRNTRPSIRQNKTGDLIEIEEYRMGQSKALLDEIDTVLAEYYHFTDDELEFIIHYDSKYRLGRENVGRRYKRPPGRKL